ncbi:hypothetical protein [Alkalihalobacillus sp. BA299]|nr:hypothetical protein [Alkalihalobacillus sp. BA299]
MKMNAEEFNRCLEVMEANETNLPEITIDDVNSIGMIEPKE